MENTEMNNQQPTNATPADNGGQGERTFTQEEVNRIVSDRLAREREKLTQQPQEDARERSLREREQALNARESKYRCEDYLKEINMSEKYRADFLDVLDTSDFDKFKTAVDRLGKGYIVKVEVTGANVANPPILTHPDDSKQRIANAFKPSTM